MNTMKAERKGKASYTEKINTYIPSGWCVHSMCTHHPDGTQRVYTVYTACVPLLMETFLIH